MMMKNKIVCVLIILISLVAFTGCTKVEKGPKGDPGAPGKGPEVITEILNINGSSWTTPNQEIWEVTVTATSVTQQIIDEGSVQMFVFKNNSWYSLPYLEVDDHTSFSYSLGKVHLVMGNSHDLLPEPPKAQKFKVVTVGKH